MAISDRLQSLKVYAVGLIGSLFLKAIKASLSLRILDPHNSIKILGEDASIMAFWHGQQLMIGWGYLDSFPRNDRKDTYVLISKSQDGRFIAKAIEFIGYKSIAGSSSRGGAEALLQLNRVIEQGQHVVFTPDGPRGPIYKVKPGVINLASSSAAKIIPAAFAASSYWQFNSWDKMLLPKPFAKAVIYVGPALSVPAELSDSEVEEYCVKLEQLLNECSSKASEMVF
jgi:lysophospholipid acyltransferase (LPLAT)-like uncharacterized protein